MTVTYLQRGSMPSRIYDILETTGEDFTVHSLTAEYAYRFGVELERWQVAQAIKRLRVKGLVESEMVRDSEDGWPLYVYRLA